MSNVAILFEIEDADYGTYGTFELEDAVVTESTVCILYGWRFITTRGGS